MKEEYFAKGSTPLHHACLEGNYECLDVWVDFSKFILEIFSRVGMTLKVDEDAFNMMQENTNDIEKMKDSNDNSRDEDQKWLKLDLNVYEKESFCTPLHFACLKGHYLVAKYLIECGANVNSTIDSTHSTQDNFGPTGATTIEGTSTIRGSITIEGSPSPPPPPPPATKTTTSTSGPPRSALHIAIGWNYLKIAKLLLQSGANPFEVDKDGVPSIHLIQEKLHRIQKENVKAACSGSKESRGNEEEKVSTVTVPNVLEQLEELMELCNGFDPEINKREILYKIKISK